MGGITLVDPDLRNTNPKDQNGQVLTVDRFKELIKRPGFDLPDIPEEGDIEDRSKGDVLFKLIAILQTSWFIIQCIARSQQRLALTELELVTLALASLNAVTFAIWWHKPLGVQKPVKIYLKIEARIVEDGADVDVGDLQSVILSIGDVIGRSWKHVKGTAANTDAFLRNPCEYGLIEALFLFMALPILLTYIISFPFFVMFPLGIVLLLKIIETEAVPSETSQSRGLLAARIVVSLQSLRYRLSSAVGKFVGCLLEETFRDGGAASFFFGWFILLPFLFLLLFLFVIFLIPFLTLLSLVSFIFTAVFGIVTTSTIRPGASHVPSFYAPTTNTDRWSRMVVFALFGVIFGGLHCIGWFFEYPTHLEKTLWRATSLAITVIPLIVAPIDLLLATQLRTHEIKYCKTFERTAILALDLIMTILLFIYVPARLCLIALALALLRNQHPTAFVAVDWTNYVPHLFS